MKKWLRFALVLTFCGFTFAAFAIGQQEDPSEVVTKTFVLEAFTELEIRGQVTFSIQEGPEFRVVVTTNRAVMDQMNVSSFLGYGTVAVESGLRGPRERGQVKAEITLPQLKKIKISSASGGTLFWPQASPEADVEVSEQSAVDLTLTGTSLHARVDWKSTLNLSGTLENFSLTLRHQSNVDARSAAIKQASVELREFSTFKPGTVVSIEGIAREKSTIVLRDAAVDLSHVQLLEDSTQKIEPR